MHNPHAVKQTIPVGGAVMFLLIIVAVCACVAVFAAERFWTGLVGVGAVMGLAASFALPVRMLPGLGLATFLLLPITYIPQVNPIYGRYLSPALFFLIVWFIRSRKQEKKDGVLPKSWWFLAVLFLAWSALTIIWSIEGSRSATWLVTMAVVFLGPAWAARRADAATIASLTKAWLWLGLGLGIMAVFEGLTSQSLLGSLYANDQSGQIGFNQVWSESRATTTLGHPLMNATFFATTAAFALFKAAGARSKLAFWSGVACTAGAAFTISRSAVTALAVAFMVGVVSMVFSRAMSFGRKAFWTIVSVGAGLTILNLPMITARSESAEGASSSYLRDVLLDAALRIAADNDYFGAGAGDSQSRATLAGMTLPFENSYAGVLVSLGAIGVTLFALLIAGVILTAMRRGLPEVAAGAAAFAVQIAAYPLVDNVPVAMILLGVLAYLAFGSGNRHAAARVAATAAREAAKHNPTRHLPKHYRRLLDRV